MNAHTYGYGFICGKKCYLVQTFFLSKIPIKIHYLIFSHSWVWICTAVYTNLWEKINIKALRILVCIFVGGTAIAKSGKMLHRLRSFGMPSEVLGCPLKFWDALWSFWITTVNQLPQNYQYSNILQFTQPYLLQTILLLIFISFKPSYFLYLSPSNHPTSYIFNLHFKSCKCKD